MDVNTFRIAFEKAARDALSFGRKHVTHPLPDQLLFNVQPFDDPNGKRPPPGMIKFRGGRFLRENDLKGVDAVTARKLLLVNGKLPDWIHMSVQAADETYTYIEIRYCAKYFTEDDRYLRYRELGNPPFRIMGPTVPWAWQIGDRLELPRPGEE